MYGAEIWSLCDCDRSRINGTELDALRRSARISKLNKKINECIREKMNAPDMILYEITRKQLIWCGHVGRMDRARLPEIMVNWKPAGRKKRGRPRRTWKKKMYTAMGERDLRMGGANGTIEGNGIWKSEGVARLFKTALYIYIYIYIYKLKFTNILFSIC